MPRRTEEEVSAAGAEAFRGAIVGAAKVESPSKSASASSRNHPCTHHISQFAPRPWLLLTPYHFQWGLIAGGLGAVGYFISPIVRISGVISSSFGES